ncbi:hypothetical protein SASPL_134879 [Salvia splendens]|uniref:Uncharacterized protein n=1 Tax=Salvia splendens TaxID=180675 RepID=A0A8X8ZFA4_SALSN|nr:hypothetical protein SASPL_134879 [Salvia splendens]
MEAETARAENRSLRFDAVSMERSKSFVTALQDLKNLRPQLYSAAEYCEKSYLHSAEKQMVLDNLKDYAVRALVNAIDHIGTVAYKLGDILEQQTSDISSMELKVTCLNQVDSVNKKVHFNPHIQTDPRQPALARARLYHAGATAAKTLSWHLASEIKSTLKGSVRSIISNENSQTYGRTSGAPSMSDIEENARMKSTPASSAAMQKLGVVQQDAFEGSKPLTPFRSFDNLTQREIVRPPVRSRSVLSAFFVKQKTPKLRTGA